MSTMTLSEKQNTEVVREHDRDLLLRKIADGCEIKVVENLGMNKKTRAGQYMLVTSGLSQSTFFVGRDLTTMSCPVYVERMG